MFILIPTAHPNMLFIHASIYPSFCIRLFAQQQRRLRINGAQVNFFSGSTIMAASYTMLLCCACVQCVLFLISNHYAHAIFPFRLSTHIFHATSYEQCMKMACNRSTQFTYMRMFALLYHASQQYRDFLAIIFRMNHGRVFYFEVISFSHTNLISHRSRGNCSCTPL